MDKNEQLLKMEELRSAMRNREFDKAAEIADSLELKKIKDNNFLSVVADAYERTRNYEDAKKALELAYENTNAGRLIAFKLCLISVKMKDFEEAKNYYDDFIEMAPRDTARYILKYRMSKAQGKSIEELISILEEYVNLDMEEKWAYELAKLYHKAGETEKCVDICDEISLWFSEGKYVNKAMELKSRHATLTASQQEKYDENQMRQEEKLENAEVKEIQLEEKNQEIKEETKKQKRRPFEINPDMITGEVLPDETKEQSENKISGDMEEIVLPEEIEESVVEEVKHAGEHMMENEQPENSSDDNTADETVSEKDEAAEEPEDILPQTEKLTGIKDVSDILKQLQERGILKAETVQQAVDIIDEASAVKDTRETEEKTVERKNVFKEKTDAVEQSDNEEVIFDDSDIIDEEELKTEEEKKVTPIVNESDDMGSTRIFDKVQTIENGDIVEQPKVSKVVKPPVQEIKEDAMPVHGNTGDIPILDLDFEAPKRDDSNDIGQKNMYENIAANSDLGYKTDKLPTREELQAAIKKAEEAVANKEAENVDDNIPKVDVPNVRVKENPSSKIEVLSGAGIVDEGEVKQSQMISDTSDGTKADTASADETKTVDNQNSKNPFDSNIAVGNAAMQPGNIMESVSDTESHNEKTETVIREDILSEAELTEFKNYLNVEGFETNIREVLQELIVNYTPNGKSDEGNVIIMGDEKTGKTTLAIELVKLVNRKRGRRNRRLAKVDAGALNRKGFRYAINKLVGSDLIVENADQLGKMTVSELIDVSGMFTDDMLIVLEGNIEGMETLIKESPRLETVFNHVVRIKEYDIKEWVEYGKQYALARGYSVDELANLAFYKAIDDFFGANKGIGQSDVEGIIDKAIDKSSRISRKVKGIFGSKTDDEGLVVLQESDFDI